MKAKLIKILIYSSCIASILPISLILVKLNNGKKTKKSFNFSIEHWSSYNYWLINYNKINNDNKCLQELKKFKGLNKLNSYQLKDLIKNFYFCNNIAFNLEGNFDEQKDNIVFSITINNGSINLNNLDFKIEVSNNSKSKPMRNIKIEKHEYYAPAQFKLLIPKENYYKFSNIKISFKNKNETNYDLKNSIFLKFGDYLSFFEQKEIDEIANNSINLTFKKLDENDKLFDKIESIWDLRHIYLKPQINKQITKPKQQIFWNWFNNKNNIFKIKYSYTIFDKNNNEIIKYTNEDSLLDSFYKCWIDLEKESLKLRKAKKIKYDLIIQHHNMELKKYFEFNFKNDIDEILLIKEEFNNFLNQDFKMNNDLKTKCEEIYSKIESIDHKKLNFLSLNWNKSWKLKYFFDHTFLTLTSIFSNPSYSESLEMLNRYLRKNNIKIRDLLDDDIENKILDFPKINEEKEVAIKSSSK